MQLHFKNKNMTETLPISVHNIGDAILPCIVPNPSPENAAQDKHVGPVRAPIFQITLRAVRSICISSGCITPNASSSPVCTARIEEIARAASAPNPPINLPPTSTACRAKTRKPKIKGYHDASFGAVSSKSNRGESFFAQVGTHWRFRG
jgi:hypothetical protein